MTLDSTPLIGQSLTSIEKQDYSWIFLLSGGDMICTESAWRLVTSGGIIVTSEDHGHQFGLQAPIDATERVRTIFRDEPITETIHDKTTGDLVIRLTEQRSLQFLQMSCGYESWRLLIQNREYICMGGGEYASFERNKS